jgi:hypothetical protein
MKLNEQNLAQPLLENHIRPGIGDRDRARFERRGSMKTTWLPLSNPDVSEIELEAVRDGPSSR